MEECFAKDIDLVKNQEIPEKISEVIKQLSQLLETVEEAVREVSLLFQKGEASRGMRGLVDVIDALQQIDNALDFLCRAGYAEFLDLQEAKNGLEEIFPSMLGNLEEQDLVALADLLEYELQPALAACRGRLPA